MFAKTLLLLGLMGACILPACPVSAQDADVPGSHDHPMISRYPGSVIVLYGPGKFDEYVLPLGGQSEDGESLRDSRNLEGKVTRIQYGGIPLERSFLEVFRNYETALKQAGFEILFSAKGEDALGLYFPGFVFGDINAGLPEGNRIDDCCHDCRYLSARLARPQDDVYVSLLVGRDGWQGDQEYPLVQLDVIEIEPMESGQIMVNLGADALAESIAKGGHVAVYGIVFDSGSATLRPESNTRLSEIVKLLERDPDLRLYVVGHTDNVGGFESNMQLSEDRASAVVSALTSTYGVDGSRLEAHGVGPLVPVASNADEAGRQRNRRVELVAQ